MLTFKRVLLVSAHPDDAEISAGGTIVRLKRENSKCKIWNIYFASCMEDPKNTGALEEHKKACDIFKIENDVGYDIPRRELEISKQKVRDILWKIKEVYKPDLVLCPSPHDYHQDHKVVAECCMTIFRDSATILGFEVPRSVMPEFVPNLYVILSADDVMEKLHAIEQYESQFKSRPHTFDFEKFKSYMAMRGTQTNTSWAETFEVLVGRV
jgi:LmbE family N-acetylglucosaminyl deacetylase